MSIEDLRANRELELLLFGGCPPESICPDYQDYVALRRTCLDESLDEGYQPPKGRLLMRRMVLDFRTNRLSIEKYPVKPSLES